MEEIPEEYKSKSGVYLIRCLVNGKVYIGSAVNISRRWNVHKCQLKGGHHHCRRFQRAWSKYGSDQFVWEVVEYVYDLCLLWEIESEYITRYKSNDPRFGFNSKLANGRHSEETIRRLSGQKRSEETRQRIREVRLGKPRSEETKQKIREANLGKPCSEMTKQKIREGNSGREFSEEHKQKISEAKRGRKQSEEHTRKNGEARRGKKQSEETVRKRSEANRGRKRSEESKQRMKEGWVLRRNKEKTTTTDMVVDG